MKIPVFIRIFALMLSGLAFVCANLFAQDSPSNPDQNSKYVGVEVCQGCHEDVYKSFAKSAHAETLKSKNPATRGCEGCHGPGAEHASAGDPELIERYTGVQPRIDSGPLRTLSRIGNQPGPHQGSSQLLDVPLRPPCVASPASARQAVAGAVPRLPSRQINAPQPWNDTNSPM